MKSHKTFIPIVLLLCCVLLISSCVNNTSTPNNSESESLIFESKSTEETSKETTTETETEKIYANDELVNKFISDYNASSEYPLKNIKQGNIRTKYHGTANGCWVEMINATKAGAEAFCVSISGVPDDNSQAVKVFVEMVKILDPALTEEQINNATSELETYSALTDNFWGDYISITYVPQNEYNESCRIDIYAYNYK